MIYNVVNHNVARMRADTRSHADSPRGAAAGAVHITLNHIATAHHITLNHIAS